jgi:cytochrome c553
MKKFLTLLAALVIMISLSSTDLMATKKLKKAHKGKKGKGGAKITCSYCHSKAKGKVPKKKGTKYKGMKTNPYCMKCHAKMEK